MRLLASADIHGFAEVYEWIAAESRSLRADAVVLAGDLLGVPDGFDTIEDAMRSSAAGIRSILKSVQCPILYIMGNDDLVELGSGDDAFESIHGHRKTLGGFGFLGYQCGPPFMKGPFERSEEELARELGTLGDLLDDRTVLVTHYPAAGTLDSGYGLSAIRDLLDSHPFLIHVHGHSHSNFGKEGRHFNVAAAARKRAVLIDLEARSYEVIEFRMGATRRLGSSQRRLLTGVERLV